MHLMFPTGDDSEHECDISIGPDSEMASRCDAPMLAPHRHNDANDSP